MIVLGRITSKQFWFWFGPIPVRTPGRFGPIPFRPGRLAITKTLYRTAPHRTGVK